MKRTGPRPGGDSGTCQSGWKGDSVWSLQGSMSPGAEEGEEQMLCQGQASDDPANSHTATLPCPSSILSGASASDALTLSLLAAAERETRDSVMALENGMCGLR